MARALCDHVATGDAVQFCVDQRHELFQRDRITIVPGDEKLRDLVG